MYYLSLVDDPQMRLVFFIVFGCCFIPIFILVMINFFRIIFKHRSRVIKQKKQIAYLDYFGDDNVISVSKNLTRVTVVVKDVEKVDLEQLKQLGIGIMITGNTIKCSSQAFADQVE